MQILESSIFGLRAARVTLRKPGGTATVALFPMVHMAEPQFYETVFTQAAQFDVVLVEGVRSPVTRRITRSYRWLQGSRRLNLSVQPRFSPPPGWCGRLVHADLSREEFEAGWRRVPFWLRWLLYGLAPFQALSLRLNGSREQLARRLAMDQEPSLEDLLGRSPETVAIADVILDLRDTRLIEVLGSEIDRAREPTKIAIIYGAGHMRAVLKELTAVRRFAVANSDWLTVFSL